MSSKTYTSGCRIVVFVELEVFVSDLKVDCSKTVGDTEITHMTENVGLGILYKKARRKLVPRATVVALESYECVVLQSCHVTVGYQGIYLENQNRSKKSS